MELVNLRNKPVYRQSCQFLRYCCIELNSYHERKKYMMHNPIYMDEMTVKDPFGQKSPKSTHSLHDLYTIDYKKEQYRMTSAKRKSCTVFKNQTNTLKSEIYELQAIRKSNQTN